MKSGDREKVQALIKQAIREWNELRTDVPLTSYIAEWLLLNGLAFVVRCKDCRYSEVIVCGRYCDRNEFYPNDDDFCSDGERRSEDG